LRDALLEVNGAEILVVRVPPLRVVESVDVLDEITLDVVDVMPASGDREARRVVRLARLHT
jgi:hypothetical protein